jgi:hypothetical protein
LYRRGKYSIVSNTVYLACATWSCGGVSSSGLAQWLFCLPTSEFLHRKLSSSIKLSTTGDRTSPQRLPMASSSFRDSMNSLGWSRRSPDVPVNTSQQSGLLSSIKSLNPFGDSGYVRLPTTEGPGAPLPARTRREEEEGWFARESTSLASLHASSPASANNTMCNMHRCGWIWFVLL